MLERRLTTLYYHMHPGWKNNRMLHCTRNTKDRRIVSSVIEDGCGLKRSQALVRLNN